MHKYLVTVEMTRTEFDSVEIEVEAKDEKSARKQAEETVKNNPNYDDWEDYDAGAVEKLDP